MENSTQKPKVRR